MRFVFAGYEAICAHLFGKLLMHTAHRLLLLRTLQQAVALQLRPPFTVLLPPTFSAVKAA